MRRCKRWTKNVALRAPESQPLRRAIRVRLLLEERRAGASEHSAMTMRFRRTGHTSSPFQQRRRNNETQKVSVAALTSFTRPGG